MRRALYHWPRWHAPPPSDPGDLVAVFEAQVKDARRRAAANGAGAQRGPVSLQPSAVV